MSGNDETKPMYCPKCGDGPYYTISGLQTHIKENHSKKDK